MLPYEGFMEEGKAFRSQRRYAEAQARFYSAACDVPPWTKPWALARFFAGWTWQDQLNYEKSLEPLAEAFRTLDNMPEEREWAALVGGVLGLSFLTLHRYADAVRVLERTDRHYQDLGGKDDAHATCLHNLALALTRSGDAAGGVETAKRALTLRERVSGPFHPMTVDTRLIAAYAWIESGDLETAALEIRKAAQPILRNAGERHSYFGDALLTEARRVAREGDGYAAEALARRALFILGQAGIETSVLEQRQKDAGDLGRLWRTGSKAGDADDVVLWRVTLQHTLRRYQVDTLDFAPSGDRPKEWFFFVPAGWPRTQVGYACRLVFAAANVMLNAREPSDPNFLDATQATAAIPDAAALATTDFAALFGRRVWEPTIAYSLVHGDRGVPLSPGDFARALAARGVPDAPLLPLIADAAPLAEARAHPVTALKSILML